MSHVTATMEDYLEKLASLQQVAGCSPVFVVWTADSKDDRQPPTTWCPDCNRCVPAVKDVAHRRKAFLLEVSVGPKAAYKQPEFYLRSSPEYKDIFEGIPTLAVYKNDTLIATTTNELCDAPSHEAALAVAELFMDKHNTPGVSTTAVLLGLAITMVGVGAVVAFVLRNRKS